MTTLSSKDRYGMWKKVGQYCNMDAKGTRAYFHNTWACQFYEPVLDYRSEIKQLAHIFISPHIVMEKFLSRYPTKQFGKHELSVTIATICKRIQMKQHSDETQDSSNNITDKCDNPQESANIVFDLIDFQ
ncbi:Conserved_hypothetical protein [Hexamita inflata]|uniref:Uncharacterized protein n=1 Tax=Hexamita inflata TaxID=28002 RepID=A0AA86NXB0_9EUKA|nr:Conserved hypothetical protein [Hexamita inflata]